jgi:hypothetical protein
LLNFLTLSFFEGCDWKGLPITQIAQKATAPNKIGDPSTGKACRITGSCSTCACPNYVQYSNDNGATWLGFTFQGTPGKLYFNMILSRGYEN